MVGLDRMSFWHREDRAQFVVHKAGLGLDRLVVYFAVANDA